MKVEVGQDSLDRWAWMIRDSAGRLVASDDNYGEAALAMEEALNQLERRKKVAKAEERERRSNIRVVR
jgi:hypothetical protein